MKTAIVTDSTAYLNPEEIKRYGIKIIPIPLIIDDKIYQEGVDIFTDGFYDQLKAAQNFPSTSQPAIGDLMTLYEDLANQGYEQVISIHLASTISGMYNTLMTLSQEITSIKVIPYDSGITIRLMGYMVIKAAQMAAAGKKNADILAELDNLKTTMNEVFIVNDLKNLAHGGRLSNASALIGSMLKIKPLLTFDSDSNKIVAFEKVRSIKKAYRRAEEILAEDLKQAKTPMRCLIVQGNAYEDALAWQNELKLKFPELTTEITYFGPVIGTHLGDHAIALAWMTDILAK